MTEFNHDYAHIGGAGQHQMKVDIASMVAFASSMNAFVAHSPDANANLSAGSLTVANVPELLSHNDKIANAISRAEFYVHMLEEPASRMSMTEEDVQGIKIFADSPDVRQLWSAAKHLASELNQKLSKGEHIADPAEVLTALRLGHELGTKVKVLRDFAHEYEMIGVR